MRNSYLYAALDRLRPLFAQAAQNIYDEWHDDEGGGICDEIAAEIGSIIVSNLPGVDVVDGGWDGDDHAYIIACTDTEAFSVDIPYDIYEAGGGYNWKRVPNAIITPQDVVIGPLRREDIGEINESVGDGFDGFMGGDVVNDDDVFDEEMGCCEICDSEISEPAYCTGCDRWLCDNCWDGIHLPPYYLVDATEACKRCGASTNTCAQCSLSVPYCHDCVESLRGEMNESVDDGFDEIITGMAGSDNDDFSEQEPCITCGSMRSGQQNMPNCHHTICPVCSRNRMAMFGRIGICPVCQQ